MTERDKELAEQAITYALGLNPEEDAYGNPLNRDKFQRDRDARFADLIRADEREACAKIVETEAMQYAEPTWAFEIVNDIRARGQA